MNHRPPCTWKAICTKNTKHGTNSASSKSFSKPMVKIFLNKKAIVPVLTNRKRFHLRICHRKGKTHQKVVPKTMKSRKILCFLDESLSNWLLGAPESLKREECNMQSHFLNFPSTLCFRCSLDNCFF